jgi:cytochrome c
MFKSEITRKVISLFTAITVVLAAAYAVAQTKTPHPPLGKRATTEQIRFWDIDVRPDGQGLPEGQGSVAEGEVIYEAQCAVCHGAFGDSEEYVQLAGGVGTLASSAPIRTVGSKLDTPTTLYDYINRAMPFPNAKSLTPSEVYALSAYILNLNDILPADAVLDKDSLPKVQMPNRDGYTTDHGFMRIDGKPDVNNTACMKNCEKSVEITSQLPAGFTEQFYGDISDNFRDYRPERVAARMVAHAATSQPVQWDGAKAIETHLCTVCHASDHKVIGPSYKDVAKRYSADPERIAKLRKSIKNGASGTWGIIPMPAQTNLADDEIERLVTWILEQK